MGIVEVGLERTLPLRPTRPALRVETVEVLECVQAGALDRDVLAAYHQRQERLLSPRPSAAECDSTIADYYAMEKAAHAPVSPAAASEAAPVLRYRTLWLLGLLAVQSLSSSILSAFRELVVRHPCIIIFITMLIGAGGNAGSQSAVITVRAIAEYEVKRMDFLPSAAIARRSRAQLRRVVRHELLVAIRTAFLLSLACYVRVQYVDELPATEVWALCLAMFSIVLISATSGTLLPMTMWKLSIDPAHSSAAIQVVADLVGVSLTCVFVALVAAVRAE